MIGWIGLAVGLAWADYSVEGAGSPDKSEAATDARVAKEAGYRSRVVRRLVDGSGWEFVARVDGLADEGAAKEAAAALAKAWADPAKVLDEQGAVAAIVEPAQAVVSDASPPSAPDALARAIEAHGDGLAWLTDAERVRLEYVRALPDGREVRHVFARRGTDLYLEITAVKGAVEASVTKVVGDGAWLVQGGKPAAQDAQRARETIEGFGPGSVLPFVLALHRASTDHPEIASLTPRGTAKVDDTTCEVLGAGEGPTEVMLAVATSDGYVRRLTLDGGKRIHEYSAYRAHGDVHLPTRIASVVDGAPRDVVTITRMEVDGELPGAWFAAP